MSRIATCAKRVFRRGDLDASITLFPLTIFRAGRSRANVRRGTGPRGEGGGPDAPAGPDPGCETSSYEGGGSVGVDWYWTFDIATFQLLKRLGQNE